MIKEYARATDDFGNIVVAKFAVGEIVNVLGVNYRLVQIRSICWHTNTFWYGLVLTKEDISRYWPDSVPEIALISVDQFEKQKYERMIRYYTKLRKEYFKSTDKDYSIVTKAT